MLRHLVATLAYRAAKVLRDTPDGFDTGAIGPTTRTPMRIVAHMADLMTWAVTMARGNAAWKAEGGNDWSAEVERFFDRLAALDLELAGDGFSVSWAEPLIQGPLADALTHVGQLALLRGVAGAPVRPESYARAEIVAGRVGPEQATPRGVRRRRQRPAMTTGASPDLVRVALRFPLSLGALHSKQGQEAVRPSGSKADYSRIDPIVCSFCS